jgi:hypothetical protein
MENDILTQIKSIPKKQLERIRELYLKQDIRKYRPDLTFLVEVMMLVALAILMYYVIPYISGTAKVNFSGAQMARAQSATNGSFGIGDVAKVEMEVSSYKNYQDYFKSNPVSGDNTGLHDIMITSAMAPLAMFFLTYVVPPFVIAYILWFIVKFWKYVISALWGWFLAMYEYFTTLIQGKLGCKWYIRMVTGWKCRTVAFSDVIEKWRTKYVDIPVYYEKLKYVKQFLAVKEQYVDRPINRYITFPAEKYGVYADYAKKLYLERPLDELIRRIKDTPNESDIATIVIGSKDDNDIVWENPTNPDEMPVSEMPVSEMPVSEMPVSEMPVSEMPVNKNSLIIKYIAIIITTLLAGLLINRSGYVSSLVVDPAKHLFFSYGLASLIGAIVVKLT